eukprot:scaffold3964_cov77-Skeletonema_marinoi.AAC.18
MYTDTVRFSSRNGTYFSALLRLPSLSSPLLHFQSAEETSMSPIGNSDDVSTVGDQSLLSSRTGINSRFVMNSSASSAPRSTHDHEMCLALADNTAEKGSIDEVAIILSFLSRKDIACSSGMHNMERCSDEDDYSSF